MIIQARGCRAKLFEKLIETKLEELLILLSMYSEKLLSGAREADNRVCRTLRSRVLQIASATDWRPPLADRIVCVTLESPAPTEWSPYHHALPMQANGRLIPPGSARLPRDCSGNNSLRLPAGAR